MSGPNIPESHMDVISTVTHVLVEIENAVLEEMPNINIVYDEELSYETGMKALIAKYNYSGNEDKRLVNPLFIYNRTVMRNPINAPAQRLNALASVLQLPDGEALRYTASHAEFDLQFLFASKSIEMQEKFEVAYQSEEGISGTKEIEVKLGDDLGVFKYFITWGELTEKTIQAEDLYIKGIVGSAVVRGMFFVFKGKASIIKSILEKIYFTEKLNEPQLLIAEKLIEVTINQDEE